MPAIHQEISINASPKAVFEALMNEKEHSTFTGKPADINREAGGSFSCHDGMVHGRNIEITPNERIVQAWRVGPWPEGVYSVIKLDFNSEGENQTRIVLDHTGYPEEAHDHLAEGWHNMYWNPLKAYLESHR